MPRSGLTAGLDIGGTKIHGVCIDAADEVVAEVRLATDSTDSPAVLASAVSAVQQLADSARVDVRMLEAIGVGIPGKVDALNGAVAHAVNLRIGATPLPIGPHLAAVFGVPVVVENDVNAAALGAGALLASDDLAYLSIGTGVAAGLLLDGRLRRGRVGVAGEIGHLSVDPAGPRCACGQRGCLEMVASGPAIARRWPTADGTSPAAALFAAATTDDRARAARDAFGGYLAHAVVLLALVVDPGLVVLGGGVSEVGVPLLDAVVDGLERMTAVSPFLGALELGSRTVLAPTDPPVAAVGAALAAVANATYPAPE